MKKNILSIFIMLLLCIGGQQSMFGQACGATVDPIDAPAGAPTDMAGAYTACTDGSDNAAYVQASPPNGSLPDDDYIVEVNGVLTDINADGSFDASTLMAGDVVTVTGFTYDLDSINSILNIANGLCPTLDALFPDVMPCAPIADLIAGTNDGTPGLNDLQEALDFAGSFGSPIESVDSAVATLNSLNDQIALLNVTVCFNISNSYSVTIADCSPFPCGAMVDDIDAPAGAPTDMVTGVYTACSDGSDNPAYVQASTPNGNLADSDYVVEVNGVLTDINSDGSFDATGLNIGDVVTVTGFTYDLDSINAILNIANGLCPTLDVLFPDVMPCAPIADLIAGTNDGVPGLNNLQEALDFAGSFGSPIESVDSAVATLTSLNDQIALLNVTVCFATSNSYDVVITDCSPFPCGAMVDDIDAPAGVPTDMTTGAYIACADGSDNAAYVQASTPNGNLADSDYVVEVNGVLTDINSDGSFDATGLNIGDVVTVTGFTYDLDSINAILNIANGLCPTLDVLFPDVMPCAPIADLIAGTNDGVPGLNNLQEALDFAGSFGSPIESVDSAVATLTSLNDQIALLNVTVCFATSNSYDVTISACDCAGVPDGPNTEDQCGVCDDDATNDDQCLDCAGVPNGPNTVDACGVCDDDPSNDNATCADCAGVPNGPNTVDACGVCDDDPSNDGQSCADCAGVPNGPNTLDACGVCDDDPSNDGQSCADCAGVPNGPNTVDACGVCDDDPSNDNATCADCAGVPNGPNTVDNCGVCDDDPTNDCPTDCAGVPGGSSTLDACGVCDDDPSNDNATCADCAGVPNGPNTVDACGVCDDDASNDNATCADCAGVPNGPNTVDACGVCDDDASNDNATCADCAGVPNGPNTVDNCGVCDDDPTNDCVNDCAGVPGGPNTEDACGVCDDDPTNDNTTCADCAGVPNGPNTVDACGVCDDDPSNDGQSCADCAGVPNGPNTVDACGVCDDDPSNDGQSCADCAGVPNGPNTLDACGVCDDDPSNDGQSCADCAGIPGGPNTLDACGVCDDDSSNDNATCSGCMDTNACNYDPTATLDDGSCFFTEGGTIATTDPTTICVDGVGDPIDVTLTGNAGTNSQWVITDASGTILALPPAPPFDLDGAGPGVCIIWHLSYEEGLMGAALGNNATTDLDGCYSLSNSITVTRNESLGGTIATTDPTTICVDGVGDPIDVTLTGNAGANSQWVITDAAGTILALPPAPPFDLDGAGPGVCVIWHLSYADGLTGAALGNNATTDLEGCYGLSNPITVTRNEPLGGTIATSDPTSICVGDGIADPIDVTLTGNAGTNSQWVITDDLGNILALPPAPPFDLDGAGAGTCLIWHLSFEDDFGGAALGNNATTDLTGCYSLSNSIAVVRDASCADLNISDPCSCENPDNYLDGGQTYFNETVTIESAPGLTWTVDLANSTGLLDDNGMVLTGTVTFTEDMPGVYTLTFWHLENVGYSISVSNGTDVLTETSFCTPCDFDCATNLPDKELERQGALFGITDFPADGDEIYSWYDENGTLVAEVTGAPYYSPKVLGTYTLIVTDPDFPGCSQTFGPRTITEIHGCCELKGDPDNE